MLIIGLDPSLTGFGYSLIDTDAKLVKDAGAWATFPDHDAKTLTSDNLERFAYLSKCLYDFASAAKPDFIFVEGTVLPEGKSAWNASLLGRCRGLVDLLGAALGVSVTELSPQAVKKGLGIVLIREKPTLLDFGGKKKKPAMASKEEVRKAVVQLYPEAEDIIPKGKIGENASDAIAVAHVGEKARAYRARLSSW